MLAMMFTIDGDHFHRLFNVMPKNAGNWIRRGWQGHMFDCHCWSRDGNSVMYQDVIKQSKYYCCRAVEEFENSPGIKRYRDMDM
jgi:hypothetical protein